MESSGSEASSLRGGVRSCGFWGECVVFLFFLRLWVAEEHFQCVGLPGQVAGRVGLLVARGNEKGVLRHQRGVPQPVDERVAFGPRFKHCHFRLVERAACQRSVCHCKFRSLGPGRSEKECELTPHGAFVVTQILGAVVLVEPCQQNVVGEELCGLAGGHRVGAERGEQGVGQFHGLRRR